MGYEANLEAAIREYIIQLAKAYQTRSGVESDFSSEVEELRRKLLPILRGRFFAYLKLSADAAGAVAERANELALTFLGEAVSEIQAVVDEGFSAAVEAGDEGALRGEKADSASKALAARITDDLDLLAESYVGEDHSK